MVRTPFYGGFGLIAADNIPKASYNDFLLLHKLGTQRLKVDSDSVLATTDGSGNLTLALWNYAPPSGTGATYTKPATPIGPEKVFDLDLQHMASKAKVTLWRVDETHSNAVAAFDSMGRPAADLTPAQVTQLKQAGALAAPEHPAVANNHLQITVPAHGLVVVTFTR